MYYINLILILIKVLDRHCSKKKFVNQIDTGTKIEVGNIKFTQKTVIYIQMKKIYNTKKIMSREKVKYLTFSNK